MDVAPPPMGSRIQDFGDRLIVRFRPKRSWGKLAFIAVWLTFWTFGGVVVFAELLHTDWGTRAGLALWLCAWAFGEAFALIAILWQLFGREILTVTPEQLEVRKEIGRFARTKGYDIALVQNIEAARVPSDEDEEPRKDFCLRLSYDEQEIPIGEGMGEREAEFVASTILERIRPRKWWGEEEERRPQAPVAELQPAQKPKRLPATIAGLIVAVVIGGVTIAVLTRDHGDPQTTPPPAAAPAAPEGTGVPASVPAIGGHAPPRREAFSNPSDYASAMTRYSLTSSKTKILGRPSCGKHATWTRWKCSVVARPTQPPFAGQTLRYRCAGLWMLQPGGRPPVAGVLCGPEHSPPLGG
jgi:hypothetical protein